MARTTTGISRTTRVQIVASVAALALISMMVLRASSAAFSGTTDNAANNWAAGTVALSDDDGGVAMFTATGMVPGDTVQNCITVTYDGSVNTSDTAFYVSAYSDADGASDTGTAAQLSDDLDVTVEMGGAADTCATYGAWIGTTTLHSATALASLPANYASGTTGWAPTGGSSASRAFHITVTLGNDTVDDAQGDSSTATFAWEAQS